MQRQSDEETDQSLRVDKWLWHARFFKNRSQATDAVAGGLVHVNDERVKPSRDIKAGDRLYITRSETRMEVTVRSIPLRRGSASEAQKCYEESAESFKLREQRRENARYAPPAPLRRPDKHDRKALRGMKGY